jgi:hypothetical protein
VKRRAPLSSLVFPVVAGLALGACGASEAPGDAGAADARLTDEPSPADATDARLTDEPSPADATDARLTDEPSPADATDARPGDASDDAEPRPDGGDAADARYASDGRCTPGVPRCHGDFGYQMCEQDGAWGESHSCEGYSSNGTTSYCAELPTDMSEPWATCIDPACWYWWKRGLLAATPDGSSVGICLPDGTISKCMPGGTLAVTPCAGACARVAMLDGRALGTCAPACVDGARECLGGPFYRACANGRWDAPTTCADGCNPVGGGVRPDVRCGGACDPGTSRCRADLGAVEVCAPDGRWTLDRACALGRCRPAGPQAECEAECLPGQRACAFDGAGAERRCGDDGRWAAERACAPGTTCRASGGVALGCVACVGAHEGGGNAFGAADSRCGAGGVETCGADDTWQAATACPAGRACASVARGPSSLAACAGP